MPVADMTVDELARRAGTTTRNVRAHQTRGLLPPPRMVGRVGYYDEGHLARLNYIDRLQERGFSLAAIQELLRGWEEGRSLTEVLGFEEALTAPWSDEQPEDVTRDRILELFPEIADDPGLLERAVEVGLLVPADEDEGDGHGFTAPSPRLLGVGAQLVSWGIPLAAALDEHTLLAADMRRLARRMVRMFETEVWEPFVAAGLPADRLPAVTGALQEVRGTTASAVLTVLARAMEEAVAASTAKQVARLFPPARATGPGRGIVDTYGQRRHRRHRHPSQPGRGRDPVPQPPAGAVRRPLPPDHRRRGTGHRSRRLR